MNFFTTKKGKAAKNAKKAAKQAAADEDGRANWPSLSPAPSVTVLSLDEKALQPEAAGGSRAHDDLIPSFAPSAHLQVCCSQYHALCCVGTSDSCLSGAWVPIWDIATIKTHVLPLG